MLKIKVVTNERLVPAAKNCIHGRSLKLKCAKCRKEVSEMLIKPSK